METGACTPARRPRHSCRNLFEDELGAVLLGREAGVTRRRRARADRPRAGGPGGAGARSAGVVDDPLGFSRSTELGPMRAKGAGSN